jgi:hypothetical protein
MKDRDHKDSYSEAIPIDDLVKMAATDIKACNVHSDTAIRKCAEKVVRSELCPCASSVDSIVDAVVEEYLRQLGPGNSDKGMRAP